MQLALQAFSGSAKQAHLIYVITIGRAKSRANLIEGSITVIITAGQIQKGSIFEVFVLEMSFQLDFIICFSFNGSS
jgi:hypothetical protein